MADRIKVVYDTGVVLQAAMNPSGPAGQTLRLLDNERIEGFISGRVRVDPVSFVARIQAGAGEA